MSHFALVVFMSDPYLDLKSQESVRCVIEEMLEPYKEDASRGFLKREYMDLTEERQNWVYWNESRSNYPPFHKFMTELEGYKFDESRVQYYYERNPNAKWDWWEIGGRWGNFFPLRKKVFGWYGTDLGDIPKVFDLKRSDILRVQDLDWSCVYKECRENTFRFWCKWQYFNIWRKEPSADVFDQIYGVEYQLRHCGLVDKTPQDFIDFEDFFSKYGIIFSPLSCFAWLDDKGWHEQGEMGWFGCSSTTPNSLIEFKKWYELRLREAVPSEYLVIVDCHI